MDRSGTSQMDLFTGLMVGFTNVAVTKITSNPQVTGSAK